MFTPGPRIAAAVAAFLMLGLLATPAPASAAGGSVRHLATTGTDSGSCLAAAPCATLEYVGSQVQPGDTVEVATGDYPIPGASLTVDDVTYEHSGSGEAKIAVDVGSYGVEIHADDITLRNLTISSSNEADPGDTYGISNFSGTGLTLDHMRVANLNLGVAGLGGGAVTVTDSTFTNLAGTAVDVGLAGLGTVTDSDFAVGGSGIFVPNGSAVVATGNVFRGAAGGGGTGIYFEDADSATTVTANRFSPRLEFGINGGAGLVAPNNWWGCNEGIEQPGCVNNYDLQLDDAEPHLVLALSASPNPFLITSSSTVTTSLASSDPDSDYVGGPVGTQVDLSTSAGTLDDAQVTLSVGSAQTALRATDAGTSTVTATLDSASVDASVEAEAGKAAQAITFTSTAPTSGAVGGSYTVGANGGDSDNAVTFSIEESTADVCTIGGATVTFVGAGTCTVNADQAGDDDYTAADQVQQTFTIGKAGQSIVFTSTAPSSAVVGGGYQMAATGGDSDNDVTFSIDATSTSGACAIAGSTVSFTGVGQCVVDADQLGNANYTAALQVQQAVAIAAAPPTPPIPPVPVTSASLSPSSFAYDVVDAGAGSLPQSKTFTLTNTGDRDIDVQAATLTGSHQADYVIGSVSCDAVLAPDEQCTYVVTFSPAVVDATYDASANLNVQYTPAGETGAAPATLTSVLSGEVNEAPFGFGANTGQVDFGSTPVATAATAKRIIFTNTGLRVVRPETASLTGPDSSSYTITADSCTNTEVAPAAACSLTVGFTPATVGMKGATLRVAYDGGSVDVALTGKGREAVPLKLDQVSAPVRCLTYGEATPKKAIVLQANAKAKVSWAVRKVRGSRALSECLAGQHMPRHATVSGRARNTGAVATDATGFAQVELTTLLPAAVRKDMKPGLYRVSFVAKNATGVSKKRVIFIRILKAER